MIEFKKTGVAAAVAGALLATASLSSHATVQLSTPGDVVLVPYVICDMNSDISQQRNTLVGLITFWKERLGLVYANGEADQPYDVRTGIQWDGIYQPAPAILANVEPDGSATLPRGRTVQRTLHWYFYNSVSQHKLDGLIPVTDNDFVRLDWCSLIREAQAEETLNGVPGYMVVSGGDDRNFLEVPSFAVYGHAYQIVGNWASQAFIPVVPNPYYTREAAPSTLAHANVIGYTYDNAPDIHRLVSGTDFTDTSVDNTRLRRDIYMRYFLDPALATENRMVFWFNDNEPVIRGTADAPRVGGETYDSEQKYGNSFTIGLPAELNIITSTPASTAFPGMKHTETEPAAIGGATVVNTGIVRLGIPEVESTVPFTSSGVTFNMVGLGAGDNAAQLQTEMATEGEDF